MTEMATDDLLQMHSNISPAGSYTGTMVGWISHTGYAQLEDRTDGDGLENGSAGLGRVVYGGEVITGACPDLARGLQR